MARVLAISSQVVGGHVGLSAIVPALQRLGHETLAIPTLIMSNHPGHARAAGSRIEVNTLVSILDVLDANGWLGAVEAMMTGYLPTPEHVFFARHAIDRVRQRAPHALILVDPVIGDDPKGVYLDAAAAAAIRDDLLPRADIITPNRFELSWLSGQDVTSVKTATAAARRLKTPRVLATSVPGDARSLCNVLITHDTVSTCAVEQQRHVPHGTGDLLSGLLIGHLLSKHKYDVALGRAVAGVQSAISASAGSSDMVLAVPHGCQDWSSATPLSVTTLEHDQKHS
jgi:pyridoxine kinase